MTNLPFDLETQQSALKRKQGLIDSMLMSGMKPQQGQMIGKRFVGTRPQDAIIQALTGLMLGMNQKGIDSDSKGLKEQYNTALQSGVENYMNTREGKPASGIMSDAQAGQLMGGDVDPTAGQPMAGIQPAAAANPRAAAIQALTSGLGPLQQLGMTDLTQMGKDSLTKKDILGLSGYDPKSKLIAALSGNVAGLSPEVKEHVVNGQIVTGRPESGYSPAGDFRDKFGNVGELAPGINGQLNTGTGEAKFAPKGVDVRVDTGQKADESFGKELAGERAKTVTKSFETATGASKALEALSAARQDFSSGIKSGIAANINLGLSKVGKALGMEADPSIASTEAFRANMARETLNLVKGLGAGTGISNADREFAEKASGGSIMLDDQAMVRLMNVAEAAAGNVLLGHQRLLDSNTRANPGHAAALETFKIPFEIPSGDAVRFNERTGRVEVAPVQAAPAAKPAAGGGRVIRFEDLP
jgi:hypothetical protein